MFRFKPSLKTRLSDNYLEKLRLTPLGIKEHRVERYSKYGLTLNPNASTFFIVLSKDFATWSESIERNSEDFFNSHKFQTEEPLKEVYGAWFEWQKQYANKPNFFHLDYIDFLENWEDGLLEIQKITGWKKKWFRRGFVNVKKVPRSPDFELKYYKKSKAVSDYSFVRSIIQFLKRT